jgi:hypothetical protein
VCRTIINSSFVGITQAETLLCGGEIHGPPPALASASRATPSHADAPEIRFRIPYSHGHEATGGAWNGELVKLPGGREEFTGRTLREMQIDDRHQEDEASRPSCVSLRAIHLAHSSSARPFDDFVTSTPGV